MASVLEIVEGDTLPEIMGVLMNDEDPENPVPYDITGWDIKLHVGYDIPLVKDAVISLGTDGAFSFPWAPGDLQPGTWPAEIQVTAPFGVVTAQRTVEGVAFKLRIRKQIA